MRKAFAGLPTNSAILDGELCLIDLGSGASFYRLMHQMRTRWPEEELLVFLAFDLLHQDGVDLRSLSLSERKRELARLCRQSHMPFLKQVESFPDGEALFDHCNLFGLRASFPSGGRRVTQAGRATTGSNQNAPIGSASTWSGISCSRPRASPS
jgi:bifunctional non-homologous end joining protein LigD